MLWKLETNMKKFLFAENFIHFSKTFYWNMKIFFILALHANILLWKRQQQSSEILKAIFLIFKFSSSFRSYEKCDTFNISVCLNDFCLKWESLCLSSWMNCNYSQLSLYLFLFLCSRSSTTIMLDFFFLLAVLQAYNISIGKEIEKLINEIIGIFHHFLNLFCLSVFALL